MTLDNSRRALHAVAELVLAGPQHRATGELKLLVEPTGFRTATEPPLRVDGADLVAGGRRTAITGSTCAALAVFAGVDVGAPKDLYSDGSGVGPDDVLDLDADDARWLEQCWAAGHDALERLGGEQPILWPEHFDVGIYSGGIGYGVSPGDHHVAEPYAYVTPPSPRAGEFWNASFGVARPMRELMTADAVHAFFTDAARRARTDPPK